MAVPSPGAAAVPGPELSFEAAARNAIGLSLTRPHGVARKGWVVSGKSTILCSECGCLLSVIHRRRTADVIVVCRRCAGAWSLNDYDEATRAAVNQFLRDRPTR
jgi:hypothetical protein